MSVYVQVGSSAAEDRPELARKRKMARLAKLGVALAVCALLVFVPSIEAAKKKKASEDITHKVRFSCSIIHQRIGRCPLGVKPLYADHNWCNYHRSSSTLRLMARRLVSEVIRLPQ